MSAAGAQELTACGLAVSSQEFTTAQQTVRNLEYDALATVVVALADVVLDLARAAEV